jgi:hypothetical protein
MGVRQFELRQVHSQFITAAERRTRAIQRQIDGDLSALHALRGFMEVQYPVSASDFNRFSARLLETHPSLLASEWVSHVRGAKERQAFEEELRRNGAARPLITEGTPQASQSASERDDYYPVRYLFPLNQLNGSVLGFDMGSCGPCLKALELAGTAGQPTTMGRLRIVEREGYGVVVVLPAYRAGGMDYAMILVQVAGVVEHALDALDEEGINIEFQDASAADANRFLYYHRSRLDPHGPTDPAASGNAAGELWNAQNVAVGNRTWRLIFTPTEAYAAAARTWRPWLVLFAGLLGTLATAGHFRSEIAHGQQSRKFVEKLTLANGHLSREVEIRKRAEDDLRTSEAEYRLLFEANTLPMWVCDLPNLGILAANRAAVQQYGYSTGELQAMTLFDLGADEDRPRLLDRTRSAFTTSQQESPWLQRRKNGSALRVEITGNPIRFHDRNACLIMAQDITRRLELEDQARQSQRLETVGKLAGGIAHDFNNLLTVVNGYCDLILSEVGCDHKISVRLSQIRAAGLRAAELTQQLLAFSRGQIIQPSVLNLKTAVMEMSRMVERLIGENIDFRLELSPESANVLADEGQISQILMNLVVNARDAMPAGGVLTIGTSVVNFDAACKASDPDAEPGEHVCLSVRDTGCGLSPEVKSRIFEPFFTTKGVGSGTGLGLATVYGMVKQQGGWISVESQPGQGAKFSIYWPKRDDEAAPRLRPAQFAVRGTESVLVVEDQEEVRKLAVTALQRYGYTVYHSSTPDGALSFASSFGGRLDLLLTDVVMPGMSGPELAEKLLPVCPGIRILYMSGYSNEADGRLSYLPKPFTAESLAGAVRKTLDGVSTGLPAGHS